MGYKYHLPFWDYEFIEFFETLPFQYKKFKQLYDDFLKEAIFKNYNLNFEEEVQLSQKRLILQNFKDQIKKVLPPALLQKFMKPAEDPIYYTEITQYMTDELKNDDFIGKVKRKNAIIVQWYIKQILTQNLWGRSYTLNYFLKHFYR